MSTTANDFHEVGAVTIVPVASWSEFGEVVNSKIGEATGGRFIFRGQEDTDFCLESSFDRHYGHLPPARRLKIHERLNRLFADVASQHEQMVPTDHDDAMALGQHFGLKTRMLDWSESRYIAAFFAFSSLACRYKSSLDLEENPPDRPVAVYALDQTSPVWSQDTIHILRVPFSGPNDRLRRQRGLFTVNRTLHRSVESYVTEYIENNPKELDRTPLYRFDLPPTDARWAIRDLSEMRISSAELFPGIEGIAKEAMLSEWVGDL